MATLRAGAPAPVEALTAVDGSTVRIPDTRPSERRATHLHFSRFADCPICNLHIAELRRRHAELEGAGIRLVVLFHSPVDQVRSYRADLPFLMVADPDRSVYRRLGVGTSPRALLHPDALRRLAAEARQGNRAREAHGGVHGLPADILIDPAGQVLLAHYGRHANDNLAVADILGRGVLRTDGVPEQLERMPP